MNTKYVISVHNIEGVDINIVTEDDGKYTYAVYVPVAEALKVSNTDVEELLEFWNQIYHEYGNSPKFPVVSALRVGDNQLSQVIETFAAFPSSALVRYLNWLAGRRAAEAIFAATHDSNLGD